MSKKIILSSLLASAAVLGAATSADAAAKNIGAVKAESKLVTVTYDKARLYTNSKLEKSSIAKKGNVYKVDGYRNIDGKHFYRVYQTDSKGEVKYRGYLIDRDTKELKAQKAEGNFKGKKDMKVWKNLYFSQTNEVLSKEKAYFAKYKYTLGNGRSYYSLYYKDSQNKEKWAGYMNVVDTAPLTATKYEKYMTLHRDTQSWKNLYFTIKDKKYLSPKYTNNFYAKRYYKLNNYTYYSMYRKDAAGKESWCGYVNGNAVKELKAIGVDSKKQKVEVVNDAKTYKDHYYNQKGEVKKGQQVIAKRYYTYGSGKSYASIYQTDKDGKETWLGYVNVSFLKAVEDNTTPSKPETSDSSTSTKPSTSESTSTTETSTSSSTTVDSSTESSSNTADSTTSTSSSDNTSSSTTESSEMTSVDKELAMQLKAAIDLLQEVNKIGAANLNNDEKYATILDTANQTLESANEGKASAEQVNQSIKQVEDFLNGLTLNTDKLTEKIDAVKETGSKVYMTKAEEDKFNEFISSATEAANDKKLSNVDKLKEIEQQLIKAEEFVAAQPNTEAGQALNEEIANYDKLVEGAKNHLDWLFENEEAAQTANEAAEKVLAELKKDPAEGENTATVEETKEAVEKATADLNKAMKALEVNQDNTTKFMNEAKAAIDKLTEGNKAQAQEDFNQLKTTLKEDYSIENYENIIKGAEDLTKAIDAAQDKELNDVIAKAKRIEGPSTSSTKNGEVTDQFQYGKYYEEESFKAMNDELQKAETAEKVEFDKITNATKDSKEEAEEKLEQDIKALKVKDWKVEEKETELVLDQYEGGTRTTRNSDATIEIPAKLKDKQVVIKEQGEPKPETDDHLFKKSLESSKGVADWNIKFIEQDGTKVKAAKNMQGAMYANKHFISVDLTGVDFSNTTSLRSMFNSDFYLKEVKGLDKAVTSHVTNMNAMLTSTNIDEIDASNWDVSNVEDMERLFRNSTVTKINMSGWKLKSGVKLGDSSENSNVNMFSEAHDLKEIELPTDNDSAKKIANALDKVQIETDVILKQNGKEVAKYSKDTDKVTASGQTESSSTITTDSATLKDPQKLARMVMNTKETEDKEFSNLPEAKQLAAMIYVGEEISQHAESNRETGHAGIDVNRAWTEFDCEPTGKSSLYDAEGLLQNYARNTKAVELKEINAKLDKLVSNMEDLTVLDNQLAQYTKEVKALAKEKEASLKDIKVGEQTVTDLQKELILADRFIGQRAYENRGVENWKKIDELTKNMMRAKEELAKLTTNK